MRNLRIPALVLLSGLAGLPAAAEETRVAVFDFELIDTSLEGEMTGPKDAETARLALLGDRLREAFATADGYALVDIAPVREEARSRNLQGCGGCDAAMARKLGAELAVTGTVQKVSNLILNINIYIRDAQSGDRVQAMSADIRGNTDKSWLHGLDWLVRNRLDLKTN